MSVGTLYVNMYYKCNLNLNIFVMCGAPLFVKFHLKMIVDLLVGYIFGIHLISVINI